jgi:hypothetical protein
MAVARVRCTRATRLFLTSDRGMESRRGLRANGCAWLGEPTTAVVRTKHAVRALTQLSALSLGGCAIDELATVTTPRAGDEYLCCT